MTDEPAFDYPDVDRDGIPDVLDIQIDPVPVDLAPMTGPLTDEQMLEMQRQADEQRLTNQTLTNIQEMRHESLKGIAQNLRG